MPAVSVGVLVRLCCGLGRGLWGVWLSGLALGCGHCSSVSPVASRHIGAAACAAQPGQEGQHQVSLLRRTQVLLCALLSMGCCLLWVQCASQGEVLGAGRGGVRMAHSPS
jgi:hypothetical protein